MDTYDVRGGQLNEVVSSRVVCVFICDVLQRGDIPVYIDSREVDAPHDDVLAVRRHGASQVERQVFDLIHEGGLVDGVFHPGDEVGVGGLVAVCGEGDGGGDGEGVGVRGVLVGKDGEGVRLALEGGA